MLWVVGCKYTSFIRMPIQWVLDLSEIPIEPSADMRAML